MGTWVDIPRNLSQDLKQRNENPSCSQRHQIPLRAVTNLQFMRRFKNLKMESIVKDFLIKKETMITKNAQPIADVYKIEKKTLGSGTYGVVCKCVHL